MSYLCDMEVRAKKALGQHFLTDQSVATRIVGALQGSDVLEVGPGMGVLTQYLIPRTAEVAGSGDSTASLCSAPPLASLRSAPVPPLNVPRVAVSLGPDVPPTGLKNALLRPVEEWKDLVVNDFEATVFRKHPELAAVKQSLYDSGAVYAAMSGSGSAIFALYRK